MAGKSSAWEWPVLAAILVVCLSLSVLVVLKVENPELFYVLPFGCSYQGCGYARVPEWPPFVAPLVLFAVLLVAMTMLKRARRFEPTRPEKA